MHPVLFTIGGLEIRSYGVLLAAGVLAGMLVGEARVRGKNLPRGSMFEFVPFAVLAGVFFARAAFVATEADFFRAHPLQALNLRAGGLNFFGGFAGGALAAVFFLRIKNIPFWEFSDCAAPGIAAGLALGRIGCFLNGCCHGIPADLPWSVSYLHPRSAAVPGIPVHPSQLYEAAGALALFFILWGAGKRKHPPGALFLSFVLLYSGLRLFLERFRADTLPALTGSAGFTWTELFFLVIMLVSIVMLLKLIVARGAPVREPVEDYPKCPRKKRKRLQG